MDHMDTIKQARQDVRNFYNKNYENYKKIREIIS